MIEMDAATLKALDDATPAPVDVPGLPITAGDKQWLESAARYMGISFAEAVAWAVQQHKADCLYPAHVERSLRLAEVAESDAVRRGKDAEA